MATDIYQSIQDAVDKGMAPNLILDQLNTMGTFGDVNAARSKFSDNDVLATIIASKPKQEADAKGPLNIIGGIKEVGKFIADAPTHTLGAAASLLEGDNPRNSIGSTGEGFQKASADLTARRAAEPGADERILPFTNLTRGDVRDASASTGFSLASMAAGAAGGVAGALSPMPGGAAIGAGTASLATAGKMAKVQISNQLLDAMDKVWEEDVGRKLNKEEQDKLLAITSGLRNDYALWEAIPEAVGNTVQLRGVGKIFNATLGKNVGTRVLGHIIGNMGMELGTEAVTQTGQHNVEVDAGLSADPKRSFTSATDNLQSLKEVAPSTIILTGLMGGGGYVAGKGYQTIYQDPTSSKKIIGAVNEGKLGEIPIEELVGLQQTAQTVSARRPWDSQLKEVLPSIDLAIRSHRDIEAAGLTSKVGDGRILGMGEEELLDYQKKTQELLTLTPDNTELASSLSDITDELNNRDNLSQFMADVQQELVRKNTPADGKPKVSPNTRETLESWIQRRGETGITQPDPNTPAQSLEEFEKARKGNFFTTDQLRNQRIEREQAAADIATKQVEDSVFAEQEAAAVKYREEANKKAEVATAINAFEKGQTYIPGQKGKLEPYLRRRDETGVQKNPQVIAQNLEEFEKGRVTNFDTTSTLLDKKLGVDISQPSNKIQEAIVQPIPNEVRPEVSAIEQTSPEATLRTQLINTQMQDKVDLTHLDNHVRKNSHIPKADIATVDHLTGKVQLGNTFSTQKMADLYLRNQAKVHDLVVDEYKTTKAKDGWIVESKESAVLAPLKKQSEVDKQKVVEQEAYQTKEAELKQTLEEPIKPLKEDWVAKEEPTVKADVAEDIKPSQKVTDRLAKDSNNNAIPMEDVDQIVEEFKKNHKNPPKIEVIYNINKLPPMERKHVLTAGNGIKVSGFYVKKSHTVYILGKNMDSHREVMITLLHEIMGHYGMYGVLGSHTNQFLDAVHEDIGQEELLNRLKEYGYAFNEDPKLSEVQNQRRLTEEVIAMMATDSKYKADGIWRRIVDWFNQAFRKVTKGKDMKFDDEAIKHLLSNTYAYVNDGVVDKAYVEDVSAKLDARAITAEEAISLQEEADLKPMASTVDEKDQKFIQKAIPGFSFPKSAQFDNFEEGAGLADKQDTLKAKTLRNELAATLALTGKHNGESKAAKAIRKSHPYLALNGKVDSIKKLAEKTGQMFYSSMFGMRVVADIMDGGKTVDGQHYNGKFVKLLSQDADTAEAIKLTNLKAREAAFHKALKNNNVKLSDFGKTVKVGDTRMTKDIIADVYAGFRAHIAKVPESDKAAHSKRMAIKANFGWTDSEALDVINTHLTDGEKAVVDSMLDEYQKSYGRIAEILPEKYRKVFTQIKYYSPIQRSELSYELNDPELELVSQLMEVTGKRSDDILLSENTGFKEARTMLDDYHQSPIKLGFVSAYQSAIGKQEHFIAYHKYLAKLRTIFAKNYKNKLRGQIQDNFGESFLKSIDHHISIMANNNYWKSYNTAEKISRGMRNNFAIFYLGFNMLTVLKQVPSIALYLPHAGHHLMKNIMAVPYDYKRMTKFMEESSPEMEKRYLYEEMRDIISSFPDSKWGKARKKIAEASMVPIEMADKIAVSIGWNSVYDNYVKALGHDGAVKVADRVTLMSQPATNVKDLPRIMTTSEFLRWPLMFTNQPMKIFRMSIYDMPKNFANGEFKSGMMGLMALVVNGAIMGMLTNAMGDGEDEKSIEEIVLTGAATDFINSIPFVGKIMMSATEGYSSGLPPEKLVGDTTKTIMKLLKQGKDEEDLDVVLGLKESKEKIAHVYDLWQTAFAMAGLPATGVKKALQALADKDPWKLINKEGDSSSSIEDILDELEGKKKKKGDK